MKAITKQIVNISVLKIEVNFWKPTWNFLLATKYLIFLSTLIAVL